MHMYIHPNLSRKHLDRQIFIVIVGTDIFVINTEIRETAMHRHSFIPISEDLLCAEQYSEP